METLEAREAYANHWLRVREDAVRRPDGSTGTHTYVESTDVALVVPLDGYRLHLVEQYRYAVRARRWELPSGSVAADDASPADCALRELREETGLRAGRLEALGVLDAAPGTLTQRCHVFLARDLTAGDASPDPEEADLRSRWFTRAEVETMIRAGELCDAKSLAAYLLLRLGVPGEG